MLDAYQVALERAADPARNVNLCTAQEPPAGARPVAHMALDDNDEPIDDDEELDAFDD